MRSTASAPAAPAVVTATTPLLNVTDNTDDTAPKYESPDCFVNVYKRTNFADQQRMLSILNNEELQALYDHYLSILNAGVERLENQNNGGHIDARNLYNEIVTLRTQRFSGKFFTDFSDKELFKSIHSAIDLINTVEPNNSLSPAYFTQSQNMKDAALNIHQTGRNHRIHGFFVALQAALLVAAIVAVCVMAVVTHGFSLMLLPVLVGGAAIAGVSGSVGSVRAHSFITQGRKEQELAQKMLDMDSSMRLPASSAR